MSIFRTIVDCQAGQTISTISLITVAIIICKIGIGVTTGTLVSPWSSIDTLVFAVMGIVNTLIDRCTYAAITQVANRAVTGFSRKCSKWISTETIKGTRTSIVTNVRATVGIFNAKVDC
jgi:hypothetical protein